MASMSWRKLIGGKLFARGDEYPRRFFVLVSGRAHAPVEPLPMLDSRKIRLGAR
jgi:hypothetical protein